jgi:hypothetical protein
MIMWGGSKIENIYMYSPIHIRYDWQVKTKFGFWIVQLKNRPYQTCSETICGEQRHVICDCLHVYYLMPSDTLPLNILFIAIRIILIMVIGRFIRSQYCRLKGLVKINKSRCWSKVLKNHE